MADGVNRRMLDRLLRVAAERAGAPSGIRFTERQLYYEVCRILSPLHRMPRQLEFTLAAPVSFAAFEAALHHREEIPGLLSPVAARGAPAGRYTPEPDLFDYGLPRLLVSESDGIAQMLRANGVQMESACPVLSVAELPLDPRVAGMLARVEQATIYLLHDASAEGLTFPTRLPGLTDIPDGVRVVPLGLRPRQAAALHLTHLRGSAPTSLAAQLDPWERAWLGRGRFVEVEAVRPASLLRTVHRLVREVRSSRTALLQLRRVRAAGFLTWPTHERG
ncbi:hypothetical protein [Nocardia sp. R6R-6]|uniref:hypothetical protein n=1 Tax=Nocardia sp. R6R-6 TaxID=3459303 RepID=UPI00403DA67F